MQAIPVRFNLPGSKTSQFEYDNKVDHMPVHYGVYLQFADDATTILPLSMDLLGYRKRPFSSRTLTNLSLGITTRNTLSA